ncbi:MAG: hypothetical protein ACP5OF_09590, partial [bacterium]
SKRRSPVQFINGIICHPITLQDNIFHILLLFSLSVIILYNFIYKENQPLVQDSLESGKSIGSKLDDTLFQYAMVIDQKMQ